MVLKAAMWVHGTNVEVEIPGNVSSVTKIGWGTVVKGKPNTKNWFHIPFTTPVILDDIRPQLVKVFVFFKANSKVRLTNVHIYDGPRRVRAFDGLSVTGDHSNGIDSVNSWSITPPLTIAYGMGISIGASFVPEEFGEITFACAGADFIKP